MIIALATPPVARSVEDGLDRIERCMAEASARGAAEATGLLARRFAPERYRAHDLG